MTMKKAGILHNSTSQSILLLLGTVKCSYDNGTSEEVIGYYTFKLNYDGLTFCTTFSDDNINW